MSGWVSAEVKRGQFSRPLNEGGAAENEREVCSAGDCVAKLFAAARTRNNGILWKRPLNRSCAHACFLESILPVVLQHNRPVATSDNPPRFRSQE
jgi:hypothetical protein